MDILHKLSEGCGWIINDSIFSEGLTISVTSTNGHYTATENGCMVTLPSDLIDAIRDLPARQIPHLRQQRERIFSERAKKGWRTRRNENKAQMDADVKTMMEMESI